MQAYAARADVLFPELECRAVRERPARGFQELSQAPCRVSGEPLWQLCTRGYAPVSHLPVQHYQIEGRLEICRVRPQGGFIAGGGFQYTAIFIIGESVGSRHVALLVAEKPGQHVVDLREVDIRVLATPVVRRAVACRGGLVQGSE